MSAGHAYARAETGHAGRQRLLASTAQADLLVQRQGFGAPTLGRHVGDTIASGGSALGDGIRGDMEQRFGRSFGAVRVHDDARAHDSARAANAAAYTVGDHVVFGSGRYRPETSGGRHLLAHELAHTVQQAGLQRRGLDGLQAGDDPALEAEANHAASAVLSGRSVPTLTRLSGPRLSRTEEGVNPAAGAGPTDPEPTVNNPALVSKLTAIPNLTSVSEGTAPKGGKQITVSFSTFESDKPKGPASNINALLGKRGSEKSLVYAAPVSALKTSKLVKETDANTKFYTGVWLSRYGYGSLSQLSGKLKTWRKTPTGSNDPQGAHIDKVVTVFSENRLTGTGNRATDANVDHMVEKQVQGQSIAENMQLLNAAENQDAGSALNNKIVKTANEILAALSDSKIQAIRMTFDKIVYPDSGAVDGLRRIEELLRGGTELHGKLSDAAMAGTKTQLQSGGSSATIHIGKGKTEIATNGSNDLARALIPTLTLQSYSRPTPAPAATEEIEATVNPARLRAILPRPGQKIHLNAEDTSPTAPPTATGATPDPTAEPAPSAPQAARKLSFPDGKADFKFVFPYLSPGTFTKFGLDEKGQLTAVGTIKPSLKFLKEIAVRLEGDYFGLVADLGPDNFKSPFDQMRVTEAALKIDLSPEFRPSGHFGFEIGPKGKPPYVLGKVTASVEGGAFVARGDLTGQNIPGVSEAKGKVRYSSDEGWSGEVTASTSKLPRTKQAQVVLGFTSTQAGASFYARGGITFDLGKDKELTVSASYGNGAMIYSGKLLWDKPIKLVPSVELGFTYDGTTLTGTGKAPVVFTRSGASFTGDLRVTYVRRGEEEGKITGTGDLKVKTAKIDGGITLHVEDDGTIWGEGSVAYQINDKIKPTIGIRLSQAGNFTVIGKIELTKPVVLFPAKQDQRELIKLKQDFIIPGPFPGLADPMAHLGAGVSFDYGIGPGQIVDTVIEGSFDPFEDGMDAQLKFASRFEVPVHVGLIGHLEAGLGIAVFGGIAAKAHGGLRVEPGFKFKMVSRVPINAQYSKGDFEFEGRAEVTGGLELGMAVKFYAHVEAAAGAVEQDWEWTAKEYRYDVAQQMKLVLAKLGYSTKTGVKWPSASDISIEPKEIDPRPMIRKLAQDAKTALAK